jgi:peptide/nickel transport system permease protein
MDWLLQVVRGNFGKSLISGEQVSGIVARRLPNTLKLSAISLALAGVIGLPLGALAAIKRNSVWDHILTVLAVGGVSIPTFLVGLLFLLVFGSWLKILPTYGMQTVAFQGGFFESMWDSFTHYVLPVSTIVLFRLAALVRYQRSAMLGVLLQDYIRTARSKGLPERVIFFRHAWRDSLVPIVTLFGVLLVTLVEGTVVVEYVFTWPGMGSAVVNAVASKDYNVLMAAMLLSGAAVVIGSLLADLLCAVADPRVRLFKES